MTPGGNRFPTRRPAPLSLRLNAEELRLLDRLAGAMPISTFIKSKVFGEHAKDLGASFAASSHTQADKVLLAHILGQLGAGGLSTSMAKLATAAETGSLYVDELTATHIRNACADILEMRHLLMHALGKREDLPPLRPKTAFRIAAEGRE